MLCKILHPFIKIILRAFPLVLMIAGADVAAVTAAEKSHLFMALIRNVPCPHIHLI